MFESAPFWMWIVGFLMLLGPLVTLHELGHYLVGRWFGVKAEAFSVGFGKEIVGRTDKRGTRWKLAAIPLGGYVQFAGDINPAGVPSDEWLALPEAERAQTSQSKPLWQRALIVVAGPVTNLLIAVAIFTAFNMAIGTSVPADPAQENYITGFLKDSPAREAGLHVGDRIAALDGKPARDYRELQSRIWLNPGKRIELTVERGDETLKFQLTTLSYKSKDQFGNVSTIGLTGIELRETEHSYLRLGPIDAMGRAVVQCRDAVVMMATGIAQIFTGARSVKELGGPVRMAKWSGEILSLGWVQFVTFVALISINLAFINLLPIPALDGGHLAFYAVEAVRRKPVGQRSQEWAFRTGVAFVLALMLFVTINDIASLPIFGR